MKQERLSLKTIINLLRDSFVGVHSLLKNLRKRNIYQKIIIYQKKKNNIKNVMTYEPKSIQFIQKISQNHRD